MLDKEWEFYSAHVQEWVKDHPDTFVLIKDENLHGFFTTLDEVLSAGTVRFGLSSFLVRRVGEVEQTVSIPALTLGVLRADS